MAFRLRQKPSLEEGQELTKEMAETEGFEPSIPFWGMLI
jgi:hypothetical protein